MNGKHILGIIKCISKFWSRKGKYHVEDQGENGAKECTEVTLIVRV
jgi:hypothetical protein